MPQKRNNKYRKIKLKIKKLKIIIIKIKCPLHGLNKIKDTGKLMKLKIQYTVHLLNSREKTDGKKINIAYRNYGNITKDSPECHSNIRKRAQGRGWKSIQRRNS